MKIERAIPRRLMKVFIVIMILPFGITAIVIALFCALPYWIITGNDLSDWILDKCEDLVDIIWPCES